MDVEHIYSRLQWSRASADALKVSLQRSSSPSSPLSSLSSMVTIATLMVFVYTSITANNGCISTKNC
uniref:Uncharacterized protein n=1 Tax=Syphacia muris TaxID=451379 RepID=A0A0N5AQH3_9BILA